mmetsp:Transcript_104747/g.263754  ORF Transcript_104747/g.263754 Transcript_104747/m.263754 type:complete len:163 (+) Transcript_104747:87-575(+)|eukprot:CAMPEP_0115532310 /NCGR_PEP_ID=MMETSP0271-20121206/85514_1 /TAXON_ID=71861 /ORGANISM="Scrippsiella trochoidea, Strain CCMP3099" /LENGTH=162 /DNA_ID=CAMNT_0002964605 /DNA_START=10 /DNA_END=498 /DNA_ORIENTATION=-
MTWGAACSNQFMPSGNGRDTMVLRSKEFMHGKSQQDVDFFGASAHGHISRPLRQPGGAHGPKAPTRRRLEMLHRGERCETTSSPLGSTLLRRSASDSFLAKAKASQVPLFSTPGQRPPHRGPRERMLCAMDSSACFFSNPVELGEIGGHSYNAPPIAGPLGM